VHALLATWSSAYSNSAIIRTAVLFGHIGGLVWGGGAAIAADRAILASSRLDGAARLEALRTLRGIHRIVLTGLAFMVASGVLMFTSDVDTFLYSRVFWSKMACVVVLLINGVVLERAERAAHAGLSHAWVHLRRTSAVSLGLWLFIALMGVALTNV
jgi:hypothetical protein